MIRQLNYGEIKKIYPSLYEHCFNAPAPKSLPPVMLIAEDENKIFGFSSGYFHNVTTFYVNGVAMVPECRTKKNAAIYEKSFHEFYKRMGIKHIIGFVENTNIRTLYVALKAGYLITGCRISSEQETLVIISKSL